MRPLFCPACLEQIEPKAVQFLRPSSASGGEATPVGIRPLKGTRRLGRSRPEEAIDYPVCPNGHPFPIDYATSPRCVVGLVGPTKSMKTHWIARIARDLASGSLDLPNPQTSVLWKPTDQTAQVLAAEYDVLWTERRIRPGTPKARTGHLVRDPIVFRADIQSTDPRAIGKIDVRKYLLLFDAPGEALVRSDAERMEYAPYLVDADLLIFFVDVLLIRAIRDGLRGFVNPQQMADFEGQAFSPTVVTACADMIRGRKGTSWRRPAPCPAVVLIAKADLLPHAGLAYPGGPGGRLLASMSVDERSGLAKEVVHRHAPELRQPLERGFKPVRHHLASAIGGLPSLDGTLPDTEGWGCTEALSDGLDMAGFYRPSGG